MFMQGKSGNPRGRPKGAKGKINGDIKQFITKIITDNMVNIQNDLNSLTPRERLAVLEKFIAYIIPKPINQNNINIDNLTENQINQIIESL